MPLIIPRHFRPWHPTAVNLKPAEVQRAYEEGFAGCGHDPEAIERFQNEMQYASGEDAAYAMGIADSGAGKLVAPWLFIEQLYPGALPGPAQARGDCVSHGQKNADLLTHCCDVMSGKPDEESGKMEGAVEISAEGIANGVFSTEAIYWYRRHGGDGWSCDEAAIVSCKESGAWIRKNYEDIGVDLTTYSGKNAGLYGSKPPSGDFGKYGSSHLMHQSTLLKSPEEIRDFLFNGHGINSCGGEGFSSERDANGLSERKGSWSHSMAIQGFDDRDIIKKIYNEPLLLVQNSWNKFNKGPRRVLGTTFDIFEGSFWARWSDLKSRRFFAFSGMNGWQRKSLPDWLGGWK